MKSTNQKNSKKPASKTQKILKSIQYKRQIRNRIGIIALLFILILALISFDFYHRDMEGWRSIDKNLNIFLLNGLNLILLITVVLLLLRNLIKLIYERRRRRLGFRLKSKLTLAFIMVSVLPMLLFFFMANEFLTNSLNFWFQGPYSIVLKNSAEVVQNYSDYWDEGLMHYGKVIASELTKQKALPNNQENWFKKVLFQYRLDGIVIYNDQLETQIKWFQNSNKENMWIPLPLNKLQEGIITSNLNFNSDLENGHIYRTLVPILLNGKNHFLEVSRILPGSWYNDLETVRKRLGDYKKLLEIEDPIRTSYTTYLLLLTFLIIFASIWFGLYLARSMIVPLETLLNGTKRISEGDLDFQIELQSDDEIGELLDSFNIMTKELQQNRVQLANSQKELIQTNKTLEARNLFVELVLENIQTGVFSIDNLGFLNAINPYMINLFKIPNQFLIGQHFHDLLTTEQLDFFQNMETILKNSYEKSIHMNIHLNINNTTVHLSAQLFQLDSPSGETRGKLFVIHDLTEIDRSTRAKAWQEVAKRIAHEIKNPLTPIQLSAQRIRRKYLSKIENSELMDICTQTIIHEVDSLKKMVNEFSKFARLPEIKPSPQNLNNIVQEVYSFFKTGINPNIKLLLQLDTNIPESLLDIEQMKRVLTNLLNNAISAIEEKGNIWIKTQYAKELKMLILTVEDTGCGVPEKIRNQIFEPYVTTKKEGTGLGLAIVHQIISDHGGFIRLNKNKPKGTIFTIELPI